MTDKQPEALRLADAFGIPHWTGLPIALHVEAAAELRRLHEENEALRARLSQPESKVYSDVDEMFRDMGVPVTEQEPVAWLHEWNGETQLNRIGLEFYGDHWKHTPLYTAPPQREWVGLTDEEITETLKRFGLGERAALARAIEAKLKEKNA